MQELSLVKIEEVVAALETAITVQEVKSHIDAAKAAEVYAEQARVGKEIKLKLFQYLRKAQRKLGEMIKAAKAAGQISKTNTLHRDHVPNGNMMPFTLAEAGISRKLSMQAQKLAAVPKEQFEKAIAEGKEPIANGDSMEAGPAKRKPIKPHYRESEVEAAFDEGLNNAEIARRLGVSKRIVDDTVEHIRIRREAKAQGPEITPDMLKLSDRKKVERAIKQQFEKMEREFGLKLQQATWRYLEKQSETLRKEQDMAKRIMAARPGYMTRVTYRKILSCLHPDWVIDPKQKRRYEEAFHEFTKLEKFILNEKESPTEFAPLPKTRAEWEELKRKATAERKAKRAAAAGKENVAKK